VANKHREFGSEEIMDSKLMGKYLIIIAVIITLISSSEANAIVSFLNPDEPSSMYIISGEINSMDVNQVKNILQSKDATDAHTYYGISKAMFFLNSSGGDIYAAMEIGRLIRKARATCVIGERDKCYSACVFVLAGAVDRIVGGEVGIHRPFSTYVGKRDYQASQNEYRRTETAVRTYLREMNLPDQLFEAMVRVPPEKIRTLSDAELETFGLSEIDPVEQDTRDATDASYYGISKTECIQRKAGLHTVCPLPHPPFGAYPAMVTAFKAYDDCREAYMFGLDVPTYKARSARVRSVCSGYKTFEERDSCRLGVLHGNR
jgi:ATP-dependent protease ClpP protease subunit